MVSTNPKVGYSRTRFLDQFFGHNSLVKRKPQGMYVSH